MPAVQLPAVKKQPAVTMPLQVISVPAGQGGRPNVPANLRTTMPFGPAALQTPRQTPKQTPTVGPANVQSPTTQSGQLAVPGQKSTSQSGQLAVPGQRKPTPTSGTAPVAGQSSARRSPSGDIKVDQVTANQSLATVPNPSVAASAAKEQQVASRKRVMLAIAVGVILRRCLRLRRLEVV